MARTRWWVVREAVAVAGLWLAVRLLPARRLAVVHGEPDWEGNAVEVLRGLARRYPGRVVWLRAGAEPDGATVLRDVPPGAVTSLPAGSVAALRALARAEVVFFTHGLRTATRPPSSRLVVNLWHGDGPKATTGLPRCASTVAVAATRLWGAYKAELFGLPVEDVAVVGNPRVDSALDVGPQEVRRLLGVPEGDRLVLWLPTFRRGGTRHVGFDDGAPLSSAVGGRIAVPDGVSLLVKPHPMDGDDYAGTGAGVVTDVDLLAAGLTLPQLLAAADALVSDASSAWVDSLPLEVPLGFFLPDLDAYGAARGYNVPDLRAVLPGPVLPDAAAVSRYLRDVRDGAAAGPAAFPGALALVGPAPGPPATDRLLDWLDARRAARGQRPLFTGATAPAS